VLGEAVRMRQIELRDHSIGRDAPDVVPVGGHEPQVAIRPRGDALRASGHREGKLRDRPAGSDPTDLVATVLGEPQVAIRTGSDPLGTSIRGREEELHYVA